MHNLSKIRFFKDKAMSVSLESTSTTECSDDYGEIKTIQETNCLECTSNYKQRKRYANRLLISAA